MAESRKLFSIRSSEAGEIKTSEEVITIIVGLAATEVDGVSSLAGGITNENVSKLGIKHLEKAVRVEILEQEVKAEVVINVAYGFTIPAVASRVQERVKSSVENMTGLTVSAVNIAIDSVAVDEA